MLGRWIYGVACASMIGAIAIKLSPDGPVRRAVRLACGLLMAATLLAPIVDFDFETFSSSLAAMRERPDELHERMLRENERLTALIIEQRCAAYIVDKSERVGIADMRAEVSAQWSADGYWRPVEARLTADADMARRAEINRYVESELGIDPARIIWIGKD
jgi:hypothetical protein